MPLKPRPADDIFDEFQSRLQSRISGLTNFVTGSFNDVFISSYSEQIREVETKALAVQLSAYPDYAGKQLTQRDLDELGIDSVDPESINEYMRRDDLDKLAKLVSLDRRSGTKARGKVEFTVTSDSVKIQEGFTVTTDPTLGVEQRRYFVDADEDGEISDGASPVPTISPDSGSETVTASVIAEFVGEEYNSGTDSLTYMPSVSPGVVSVTNPEPITGGDNIEQQEEFRERVKSAVFQNTGGGIAEGVIGEIQNRTDFDVELSLSENFDDDIRTVEVVANVASESPEFEQIEDIADNVRPVGVKHEVITPTIIGIGLKPQVVGDSVQPSVVTGSISDFFVDLGLGDDMIQAGLSSVILNSSDRIRTTTAQNTYYHTVQKEKHEYTETDDYIKLNRSPFGIVDGETYRYRDDIDQVYNLIFDDIKPESISVETVIDGSPVELTAGTDFSLIDSNNDGNLDAIDFSVGGRNPTVGSEVSVSYKHTNFTVATVETDNQVFTEGTDYTVGVTGSATAGHPDGIQWLQNGERPTIGENVSITYTPNSLFTSDLLTTNEESVTLNSQELDIDIRTPL